MNNDSKYFQLVKKWYVEYKNEYQEFDFYKQNVQVQVPLWHHFKSVDNIF